MIKITSQQDLDAFLAIPNWDEAFVREWYLLSPTYIHPEDQAIVALDSPPTMRVLICIPDFTCPGVELFFEEVEEIYLSCRSDLRPAATFRNNSISFSFYGNNAPETQSKSLYYQILEKDCWDWKVRYGIENIFDQSGFLISSPEYLDE